ncbi:hypothetical protein IV203_000020 (plastid) [Nitzschia inconspicua]|uniref:Uncharacterized protein n=1 Tax=Nitzschia inconspicua TaxID=303405 RepID=A0A8H2SI38_9STRA|nr:hypothetical protein IV203_000020 [Nitzschia inconspicua]
MFNLMKKIVMFIPSKLVVINNSVDKIVNLSDKADKTFTYVSKVVGTTTGTAGLAKGAVDVAEALACQDGVCAIVSAVGVAADGLQICTSFIPGPNVTSIITIPVSVGCKVVVWCCKKSKLPWGGC